MIRDGYATAVILMYHRVSDPDSRRYPYRVSPAHFCGQMRYISKRMSPISLDDLVEDLRAGKLRSGSVVVTFDDGYEDNAEVAAPILRKFEVPATFYVTSSNVLEGKPYWWDRFDRIAYLMAQSEGSIALSSPPSLASVWVDDRYGFSDPLVTQAIRSELMEMGSLARDDSLDIIEDQIKTSMDIATTSIPGPMSVDQLRRLASDPLFTIGAHSVTHPVFLRLDSTEKRSEIFGSKEALEGAVGNRIDHMAIPYGVDTVFDDECIETAREAGYLSVATTRKDAVHSETTPMLLPRFGARDTGSLGFRATLRWWQATR